MVVKLKVRGIGKTRDVVVDGKVNHKMYGLATRFLRFLFAFYVAGLKRLTCGNFVEIVS
jgi:hypothetical protein